MAPVCSRTNCGPARRGLAGVVVLPVARDRHAAVSRVGWPSSSSSVADCLDRSTVRRISSETQGQSAGGKPWAIPGIITSRAPGTAAAVARPPEGSTNRSAVPWITVVGRLSCLRRVSAIRRGDDRGQLARGPGAVDATVKAPLGDRAGALRVGWVALRSDCAIGGHEVGHVARTIRARSSQKPRVEGRMGLPDPAAPGRGHDADQRERAFGVLDRDQLGDHPAHRDPDEVRRVDLELGEQPGGVRRPCPTASRRRLGGRGAGAAGSRGPGRHGGSSSVRCPGCRSESRTEPRSASA